MAGNTKFLGFERATEVVLERWGKKVNVTLDSVCIDELRDACYEKLPKKPPHQEPALYVGYDYSRGSIEINLPPDKAKSLKDDLVLFLRTSRAARGEEENHPDDAWIPQLIDEIELSLEEHRVFTDPANEPGVE